MKTRKRFLTQARLGLMLVMLATLLGVSPVVGAATISQLADQAAVPGLPFTEDFASTDLRDDSLTNANWSTEEQALVLAWRQTRYGAFGPGSAGSDITADADSTRSVALGDVDGDGHLDLVAANSDDQPNRLYLNDGSGAFGGGSDVSTDSHNTQSVALGDVDGDGDLDLVAGNYNQPHRLYLNDGSGTFDAGSDVSADTYYTYQVVLEDVDSDGDLDLVAGNRYDVNRLYLNDGNGTFDAGSDVGTDTDATHSVALGDVDGDGDLDLITGNANNPNRLYLNDGGGTFSAGSDISTDTHTTLSVALGDVDGDGDLDLVAGNQSSTQSNRLYLNNGTTDPFSGVAGSDVTTDTHYTRSIVLGDVDGDGDLDLIAGNSGSTQPNRLYLNDGSGVFGAGSDISADTRSTYSVALGDVDVDGDLDLVAGNDGQANRLYLNDGTPNPFTGVIGSDVTADTYSTYSVALGDVNGDGHLDLIAGNSGLFNRLYLNNGTPDPFNGVSGSNVGSDSTRSVALGDVDGDGDLDLVAGNDGQPNHLYLNDGDGDPFDTVIGSDITTDTHSTWSVVLGDVNGDGDLDLVAGNYGQPNRLYLNNGTETPFSGVTGSNVGADDYWTYSVALGDMDGDGHLDLVAGNYAHASQLYLNNGTANPFDGVIGNDITDSAYTTWSVALGDVDGDGDLDLVTGNQGNTKPNRLYLNDGSGTFGAGSDVSADTWSTFSVALGDVDGDGDLDLVAGNYGPNRLYLNNGSADPFSGVTGSDISADTDLTGSVALGDVDGDGHLDLVAGHNGQRNRLYLNGGGPSPANGWAGSDVTADDDSTTSVALGDVDGDGDLDLVAGNYAQRNRLYLNDGSGTFVGSDITTGLRRTNSVALGDVDGDGDLDLVVGNQSGTQRNRLYLNNGTANPFSGVTGSDVTTDTQDTFSVALGDVDGDGNLDLVAGNAGQPNRLYLNNGTENPFDGVIGSDVSTDTLNTYSVALGDVDGDGDLDLIAGGNGPNRLYLNDGGGAFGGGSDISISTYTTYSVALGDVDGDGDLDLVAGNAGQPNRLYMNDGSGTFVGSDISTDIRTTSSVALGDVDGDGDLDLVAGNAGQANQLYLNNGTANPFGGVAGSDITTDADSTRLVALGDMDGDGDLDLVAGNYNQANQLYRRVLYHTAQGQAGSLEVDTEGDNIDQAMLIPTASLPPNTHVTYYLSNNGGARWFIVRPGVMFVFPTTGNDLRWRAELHSLSPVRTPRIDQIRITAQHYVYLPLALSADGGL